MALYEIACTFFYMKKAYWKMKLKLPKSSENHKAQFPGLSVFVGQKSIVFHYCIQHIKERIQIRVYKFSRERVTH